MGEKLSITFQENAEEKDDSFDTGKNVEIINKNDDFDDYSNQLIEAAKEGRISENEAIKMMSDRLLQIIKSREENPKQDHEILSDEESEGILDQTLFKNEGDKEFVSEWAAPKYSAELEDGSKVYFSDFSEGFYHPYTVCYTKNKEEDTLRARIFYTSSSAGLWRLLPRIRRNPLWFDKGPSEDSVNAPFEMQEILDRLYGQSAASAKKNQEKPSREERRELSKRMLTMSDALDQGENTMELLQFSGCLSEGYYQDLVPPENCTVPDNLSPDFSHVVRSWRKKNALLGEEVTNRCFDSKDKSLQYLFSQAKDGRAWVAAVERQDCEMNKLGLKSEYVVPGSLGVPLYEYEVQDSGYGDHSDRKGEDSEYVSMEHYLSRIPIIKEFQQKYEG